MAESSDEEFAVDQARVSEVGLDDDGEAIRRSRISCANESLGRVADLLSATRPGMRLSVRPVRGDGLCFFRAAAAELGLPGRAAWKLYRWTLVKMMKQRNQQLFEALQLDEYAVERRARLQQELPAQVASGVAWGSLPNWKVFYVDICMGLHSEDVSATRRYADAVVITHFLEACGALALYVPFNAWSQAAIFPDQGLLQGRAQIPVLDFAFVHYDVDGYSHYDAVDVATSGANAPRPWEPSTACRGKFSDPSCFADVDALFGEEDVAAFCHQASGRLQFTERECGGREFRQQRAPAAAEAPESDSDADRESSPSEPASDSNSELSEAPAGSEQSDVDHLACGADVAHTTLDVAHEAARAFSAFLRQDPTLPPPFDPSDAADNIQEVMDGLQWPICNCAVRQCRWTGETEGDLRRHVISCHQACLPAAWRQGWNKRLADSADDVGVHAEVLEEQEAWIWSIYCQAVEVRARTGMPALGICRDRRAIRTMRQVANDACLSSLVCFCCGQIYTSVEDPESAGVSEIGWTPLRGLLRSCPRELLEYAFGLDAFLAHFPHPAPDHRGTRSHHYPTQTTASSPWVRTVRWNGPNGSQNSMRFLCCPEDVVCDRQHGVVDELCESCRIPLCWQCRGIFAKTRTVRERIPRPAIANDNFVGFVSAWWEKHKPRWIEMAAATPVWTSLMAFYVEGDKGHLMNNQAMHPHSRYAVRGNLASFLVHWDDVLERLLAITESSSAAAALPHDGETLAHLVRFEFRMKDKDMSKHLKHMRLRAHVVLQLGWELIDRGHPAFCRDAGNPIAIAAAKEAFERRVKQCYPWLGTPQDTDGKVPPAVDRATVVADPSRSSVQDNKHATPALASTDVASVFDDARPTACAPTDATSRQGTAGQRQQRAMDGGPVVPYVADAAMLEQWNGKYPAIAFPHTLLWQSGGPDFTRSWRNGADAAHRRRAVGRPEEVQNRPSISMGMWLAGMSRRVEHQIRSDWLFIPGMRNVHFRFLGITARLGSKVRKYKDEDGSAFTERLTTAVRGLHDLLAKGYYGPNRRPIAGNLTVLHMAHGLDTTQKQIVHNMRSVTSSLAGTQELRRRMGHVFQSGAIGYGHGLFITISPNEKQSCLVMRLHRARQGDPLLRAGCTDDARNAMRKRLASREWPSLSESADAELPDFDLRLCEVANDPLSVVQGFRVAVNVILGRLLGLRLCAECGVARRYRRQPRCCCTDKFGSNSRPMGGIFGVAAALLGAVENQHLGTLHFHGFVYLANMFQHAPLTEIARTIRESPGLADAVKEWHAWVHREEHWAPEEHRESLPSLESEWRQNHRASEHVGLCRWPAYVDHAEPKTKWDEGCDAVACDADAATFKQAYEADAQMIFSKVQHHHHPNGKPLTHCIKKGCKHGDKCKHGFPKTMLMAAPDGPRFRVVCPQVAREVGLKVNGPRSALGEIAGPRNDDFLSGTCPALAVAFRSNTHTAPNNRLPLITGITHDPNCLCRHGSREDTEEGHLRRIAFAVQRSMSNSSRYIGGYISKVQRVGKKARELAKTCLSTLAERLHGKSEMQQTLNTVHRCIGDWEAKGVARTIFEEVNLAHFADRPNPLAAECITSCPVADFYAGCFLQIVADETRAGRATARRQKRSVVFTDAGEVATPPDATARAYAYRPNHAELKTLSPYEFVRLFEVVPTYPPPRDASKPSTGPTEWKANSPPAAADGPPRPGVHYVVKPPAEGCRYFALEEDPDDMEFAHMYVIVPRGVPALPVFIGSVMPQPEMTPERRSAILSAYFRPWTLVCKYGSSRGPVPLAKNLNLPPKRQRCGRSAPSFRVALKHYLRGHIVSPSNRILWANVLRTMTTMPENADEGEDDQDSKPVEALPENAFPVLSPSSIMAELRRVDRDAGADAAGEDIGNLSHSVHKALEQSMSFWDPPNRAPTLNLPLRQSALRHSSAMPAGARGNAQEPPRKIARSKMREKLYPGDADLTSNIQSWRRGLQTHQITPDPQQMSILDAVADRCVQEAREQDQLRGSPCSRLFVLGLPGSGKSEVIRWLCEEGVGLFPTCMGWEHEVHFIKTAPMNSMASNIGGRTIHNFSKLGIDLITGVQSGGKKDPELSENMLHTKIQHMRWLIIDEVENVSVELLDAVHRQVKDSTRDKGNPWAVDARVPKQFAMFGGLNLVLLGDLWQIPPVRSLSIAANPFVKRPANVGRILEMFWTEGLPHSVTNRYALAQSHRCSDVWWRSFLAEARAGNLSDRMYDFVHGFPTDVPGSWMPASPGSAEASTGHFGCGKAKCRALWSVEWPRMFGEGRAWEDMKSLECAECSAERHRRCRVASQSDARQREVSTAFADALFVHPYNAPKSRILTLRAANAAANAGKQLLWVVARDVPLTRDDACRSTESLSHARQNWLMYPENKTGGVPGVLPIFEGMRARFTTTENAEAGACKHSWGTVTGWVLHPDDSKLVKDHRSEPELVLQHVPEAIMVQIPGNTAPRFGNQPAGVFPVKQREVSWDRSPGFKAMVKRAGFPLVPHFAATAHCVTGATLPQAIIDLLDARTTPRAAMVPTGYVAISRTRRADDLIITQPFSPMLFRQGHQTGPWLLHSLTAGEMTTEQAEAGWAKAEKEAASRSSKKLVDVTFQCADCHQRKRAGNFPGSGMRTSDPVEHAVALLCQGAWRRCALCAQKRTSAAGAPAAAAEPFAAKGRDVLVCNRCKETKSLKNFRRSEVNDLTGRGALDLAVCVACTPERQHFNIMSEGRLFKCRICSQEKAADQFDAAFFKMHKSVKDAACTECLDEKGKPLCQGGCGARPPDRLTYSTGFWCESCKFPPCARCGTTPRPKTAKYRVWNMKEWTCAQCRDPRGGLKCAQCSAVFMRAAVKSSQRDKADMLCPACRRAE
ncbi:unnamed protein product [Prorocentrum cordatum]|uniref:ATP-dependent DNA helicase n=2 Tax=Prorocentrum cordatum TaxID=2364126 RepID=A0ABN9VM04_9DINO|nr:unnamed protein product [Polarella glacialis]